MPRASPTPSRAPHQMAPSPVQRVYTALLGVPLAGKLVGANALVAGVAVAVVVATSSARAQLTAGGVVTVVVGAVAAALAVSLGLVALALRPLHALEATATRVSRGDLDARVPESPFADPAIARVSRTFNLVLDGLAKDRARLRALAAEAFRAGDAERSRIGRELHDSAAQTLAAALYQVSAARRAHGAVGAPGSDLDGALAAAQRLASDALDEVCTLAQGAYPRVLDELGLPAALRVLGHRAARQGASDDDVAPYEAAGVTVDADPLPPGVLGADAAAALYHIAQQRVAHAASRDVRRPVALRLRVAARSAVLEIDEATADGSAPPVALAERVSLVGGTLTDVRRAEGRRITICVPLEGPVASGARAPMGIARSSLEALP